MKLKLPSLDDACMATGIAVVAIGLWQVYSPLAWIWAGAALIVLAVRIARMP